MLGPDLYGNVVAYLNGESTLRALEEWVVPRLPLLLAEPRGFTSELTATVELGLAELGEGLIEEATVRERLAALLNSFTPTFPLQSSSEMEIRTGTASLLRPAPVSSFNFNLQLEPSLP